MLRFFFFFVLLFIHLPETTEAVFAAVFLQYDFHSQEAIRTLENFPVGSQCHKDSCVLVCVML